MGSKNNKYLVLVAGGKGLRMGGDIPKQFMEINGKAILLHTIERFAKYDPYINIVLVLPKADLEFWNSYCASRHAIPSHKVVTGGKERFYSVKNGLAACGDSGIIAIHDGVRPLVSTLTISRCFNKAEESANAIPFVSPCESVRQCRGDTNEALDRSRIKLIQTPQVFDAELLHKAYDCSYSKEFTDDATVVERLGESINLVEGNRENIKITTPEDLIYAKAILS